MDAIGLILIGLMLLMPLAVRRSRRRAGRRAGVEPDRPWPRRGSHMPPYRNPTTPITPDRPMTPPGDE